MTCEINQDCFLLQFYASPRTFSGRKTRKSIPNDRDVLMINAEALSRRDAEVL